MYSLQKLYGKLERMICAVPQPGFKKDAASMKIKNLKVVLMRKRKKINCSKKNALVIEQEVL